jgi:hypothetical protein
MFTVLIIFILVFTSVDAFSQLTRKNQFEIYAGAGFPLGPDDFKDYYKVGLSLNVQYVFFPTYRLGIPIFVGYEGFAVDNDAINNEFQGMILGPVYDDFGNYLGDYTDANLDVEGSASMVKFGVGLRPYLTSPEASTQLFLFGTATYNILKQKQTVNSLTATFEDYLGNLYEFTADQTFLDDFSYEDTYKKFGVGFGAGIEVPVGEKLNLIFQGMYNMIFTEKYTDEYTGEEYGGTTSFIGVTGGVVF